MKKRVAAKRKTKKTVKATKSTKARKTKKTAQADKSPAETLAIQQDIAGLLSMLVQKLSSFETKLDTVMTRVMSQPSQTLPRPVAPAPMPMPERPRPQKVLYAAICAHCGKDCEIPFKPSGTRPVYCRECFAKRKNNANIKPPVMSAPVPQPSLAERIKVAEAALAVKPPPKPLKTKKTKTAAPKKKTAVKKKKKVSRRK